MKRFGQLFLTMVMMAFGSLFLLLTIGIFTYFLKWQADIVMMLMTFVYILTGLIGGLTHRKLCPLNEKYHELFQKIGGGILIGSLYILLLLGFSVLGLKHTSIDIGRVFLIWFLVVGSGAIGELGYCTHST